jgi:hypothetical protein
MAEDKFETRDINYRQWLPWTQIFRGFWIAVDPKKLLLAAGGILVMAFGWWLLATIFYSGQTKPTWPGDYSGNSRYQPKPDDPRLAQRSAEQVAEEIAFEAFKRDRHRWNLLHEAAGTEPDRIDAGDLARDREEYEKLQGKAGDVPLSPEEAASIRSLLTRDSIRSLTRDRDQAAVEPAKSKALFLGLEKRYGELRTWPWFEDRGPNPFRLVTDKTRAWEPGHFFDWLLHDQIPVLIEPLVKFFRPIIYFLEPDKGVLLGLYFLLVLAWTVATWAIFGGALTRMAAVEMARNDKISLGEAVRFVLGRWKSYIFASFAPVIGLAVCALLLIVFFGIPNWIPIFREFWVGLLMPLALGLGLCMAVILIGLPGWPMIHATLGAEGSDSFDALSRCYSYVLQKPWSYIWYALVALIYGAVVVFFVGFMGSLMIYLAKWGISETPLNEAFNRDPSYMFIWAPTSYHWRDLLTQGSSVAEDPGAALSHWWNYVGPFCVAIWLGLVFLMIVGFGYSYFWTASTIIYLMMRRKVDDTELDEVYLEEEEPEDSYTAPATAPPASAQPAATPTTGMQMVEPPSLLRTAAPSTPSSSSPSPLAEETAASPGDGNIPAGGTASSSS